MQILLKMSVQYIFEKYKVYQRKRAGYTYLQRHKKDL